MRIGVVSDVHSNPEALQAALDAMRGEVDEVWCAGDIVLEYRFCGDTIGLLRDAGVPSILGNHDVVLLTAPGLPARKAVEDDDPHLAWLGTLPYRYERDVDGARVLMVHGNPWEPWDDYLPPHDRRWHDVDQLGVDIVLTGHTHLPMAQRFGRTLVVNPGSTSEPRQRDDRPGTYALVDTAAGTAEIVRLGC